MRHIEGFRLSVSRRPSALHDFLPDKQLRAVWNMHEFVRVLVFDKWKCNTNERRTVFFRRDSSLKTGAGAICV